jgi:acetyl esterase/lipase
MTAPEVVEVEVEYRRHGPEPLLAQVYRPAQGGPYPALLDVHGGAWSGNHRFANAELDRLLAATGMVVVAIDFRLAPQDPYPAMVQDVNYATRWIKRNASALGIRPGPVGALGTSSGGHLVLLSAVRPFDPRYAALPLPSGDGADASLGYVVACWPPVDPYLRYEFARETGRDSLVEATLGCFGTTEVMKSASPERIVAAGRAQALPPVLVVQGTADANIPMPMIERFSATYRAAGGALQLEAFADEPHGFAMQPGPQGERALALILDFVARQVAAPVP